MGRCSNQLRHPTREVPVCNVHLQGLAPPPPPAECLGEGPYLGNGRYWKDLRSRRKAKSIYLFLQLSAFTPSLRLFGVNLSHRCVSPCGVTASPSSPFRLGQELLASVTTPRPWTISRFLPGKQLLFGTVVWLLSGDIQVDI